MTLDDILIALPRTLQRNDWPAVEALCASLVHIVLGTEEARTDRVWKSTLGALRKKRRFACMGRVAEALVYTGQGGPNVLRQYAQSLIDRGLLVAAERLLLDGIAQYGGTSEAPEFRGLMGRVLKQWYVNSPRGAATRDRLTLQRAVDTYVSVYRENRDTQYWHGINAVALLERAKRDGLDVSAGEPPSAMAQEIAATTEAIDEPYAFDIATTMEAHLALNEPAKTLQAAREYISHKDADAFEFGSTIRQLEEVWQLKDTDPLGALILPLLRAALLSAEGGALALHAQSVAGEVARVDRLQRVYGFDRFQTLDWYRQGLDRCNGIARIETTDGHGVGTGWLIRAGDWFRDDKDERPLLVTNAHVLCDAAAGNSYPGSLSPPDAQARFQVLGATATLRKVVWSSPPTELDCTVATLDSVPEGTRVLPLATSAVRMLNPPPRLFIIGHPKGGDIQFSLQDNFLESCDSRLLRYRTPTEHGSSGSPVFDLRWQVVGLHHAGDADSLDANEGIALTALRAATRNVELA